MHCPKDTRRAKAGRYVAVKMPDHPRANKSGYVREHILIAERALGSELPPGAVVHHVNGNPRDNRRGNLVVCESDGYHHFLHRRLRALREGGDVHMLRCSYCKRYDDPKKMYVYPGGNESAAAMHRACHAIYERDRLRQKRVAA